MEINVTRMQGSFKVKVAFRGAESGVTALYGHSGAGKSSVINMVAGLMKPDRGHISVNGIYLFDSVRNIDLPPERRRIGYVFQDGRLLPHLSVRANLTYGMKLIPADARFVTFDSVVELLGISHLLNRRPNRLSGGEKQRVAIGRALLTSPTMLLMDEPLASLDALRKGEILPFIMRLSREYAIPILYVSHIMTEIINLADQLVIMEKGEVIVSGSLEELFSNPELQTHFSDQDYGSILTALVEEPLDASGLMRLRFGSNLLKVLPERVNKGNRIRVRIAARHIGIALKAPEKTSFQNIFQARVDHIIDSGKFFVDIRLNIGQFVWARITRKSFLDMNLEIGKPVFALIKSVALSFC